jgi:hypothetical protein
VRSLTRPGLLLAIAVIALPTAASGALSAPAAPNATAANTTTYTDSSGEIPNAPDITTLVTSNNDAGLISFRINIPNRPQLTQDMLLALEVDSDNNASTGSPEGTDYAIELVQGEVFLYRWDGTNFTRRPGDPPATSLIFSYQGGATLSISTAELGNTRAFRFSVVAISGVAIDPTTGDLDFTNALADFAPAVTAGLYSYQVRITRPTLVVRRVSAGKPVAGKPFTLRVVTARSDTNAVVQNGRVTCVGRVGNARLRAQVQRMVGGAATCTWNLPATSKGKTFRGSVGVAFEGLRASQAYSKKVR